LHIPRVALLFVLPIAVLIWLVGWSMYWIGGKRTLPKPETCPCEKCSVEQFEFCYCLGKRCVKFESWRMRKYGFHTVIA
jgi:hypothetical protein